MKFCDFTVECFAVLSVLFIPIVNCENSSVNIGLDINDGEHEWSIENEEDIQQLLEYYDSSDDEYTSLAEYMNGNVEDDRSAQKPIDTVIVVIYSIITVVGLLANAVVFFVIFAGNEIGKTVTAIYVLQLTIADTIFLFTLPIFSMQKVLGNWTFGSGICTMCQTIKFMNYYAGIFILTAMSVDRYVAVAYSTRLKQVRTKKRTYAVCICMWIFAILMSLPLMMYARTETALDVTYCRVMFPGYKAFNDTESYIFIMPKEKEEYDGETSASFYSDTTDYHSEETTQSESSGGVAHVCKHDYHSSEYKSWIIVDFVIGFAVPFAIILISYLLILTHLKTSEQKIGHTASNRAAKMRKRVTRMVAALVICFAVCWLPHHLFALAKISGIPSSVPLCYGFEQFLVALAFSNSAINPILYTFMGNNFKERLRKSVDNTSRRLRKTSRSSLPAKHSSNTHSDQSNHRKLSALINYRRGSKNSNNGESSSKNGRKMSKLSQIALLGSHRPNIEATKRLEPIRDDQHTAGFYAMTTIGEQTVETRL